MTGEKLFLLSICSFYLFRKMSIDDEIILARRFFRDMRNVMPDSELLEIARKLWDLNLNSHDEAQPCYFTECFANQIFHSCNKN